MTSKFKGSCGWCGRCEKLSFLTRKIARSYMHGSGLTAVKSLAAYQCPDGVYWHLGNLDPRIKDGKVTRGELYG